MPLAVIKYLRTENIITWSKVGRQIDFDEESVEIFEESFDRNDYLTRNECAQKLKKHGFYSSPDSSGKKTAKGRKRPKMYSSRRLGPSIYITVKTLINGSTDTLDDGRKFLPDEYKLEVREFGRTKYFPRKSFAKTLKWLWRLVRPIGVPPAVPWVNVKPEKERSRKRGIQMPTRRRLGRRLADSSSTSS